MRIKLLNELHFKMPVLKFNTNGCFKLFYELMNPSSAVDKKTYLQIYSGSTGTKVVDLMFGFSCVFCLMFI